jgi:hypothetical protein
MNYLKKIVFLISVIVVFDSCKESKNFDPNTYLTAEQSEELLKRIVPYSAKLPKGYTYENRFEARLDSFYVEEIKKYKLEKFYQAEKDSFCYFLVTRSAPSLYEKRIAIGGKFTKDATGKINSYEEAFWTFKLKLEDLQIKTMVLFSDYVDGKDLSKYQPENMEDWIEFPDKNNAYDKREQRWKTTTTFN